MSMYNEQLEQLIDYALADGELTEKEKQVLFKKAESMGVDLDEFEMVLDARLVELKKKEAELSHSQELELAKAKAATQASAPKSEKFGDVRKCPSCGAMLQSFQTKCDECGYEFRNIGVVNSSQKLFDLLQAAELRKSEQIAAHHQEKNRRLEELSRKHNNETNLVKIFSGSKHHAKQDEEREDLIRELNNDLQTLERKAIEDKTSIIKNFPVPNSKEDLLELLAMASSNAYDNDGVIGPEEEVWIQKTDQIYQKIIVCASNDKTLLEQATNMVVSLMKRLPNAYKKFTVLPQNMKAKINSELKAAKKAKRAEQIVIFKKYGIWGGPCLVLGILFLCIGVATEVDALAFIALLLFIATIVIFILGKKAWDSLNETPFS